MEDKLKTRKTKAESLKENKIPEEVKTSIQNAWRTAIGLGLMVSAVILTVMAVSSLEKYRHAGNLPPIDTGKWQAVFFNNNQIYFGRLSQKDHNYLVLRNVFFFKFEERKSNTAIDPNAPGVSLVRLTSEIYSPEDQLFIPTQSIAFWENLNNNSQIVRAMESSILGATYNPLPQQ